MIGGEIALRIAPGVGDHLAAQRIVALVSGTNGKTTTSALLAAALRSRGPVCVNGSGANLANGLVGALLGAAPGVPAVLETDEAVLPYALANLRPKIVVLLNLSRDQLDRMHEVRRTAQQWRTALLMAPGTLVVANADDPLIVWAAESADATWVAAGQPWRLDASACPGCGGIVRFDEGGWSCTRCTRRRPSSSIRLVGDTVLGADQHSYELRLELPGRASRANAAMALAAASLLGIDPADSTAAMRGVSHVADRYRTVTFRGQRARLLLAKNPAGWVETLDLLHATTGPILLALNARTQDGLDPSWVWDVPFEDLRGRRVVCTGERSADLALRLAYAEVDHDRVADIRAALVMATSITGDVVEVAANYSAFQQLRKVIANG